MAFMFSVLCFKKIFARLMPVVIYQTRNDQHYYKSRKIADLVVRWGVSITAQLRRILGKSLARLHQIPQQFTP